MRRRIVSLAAAVLVLVVVVGFAAPAVVRADEVVTIGLRDGSRLVGRVVSDDGERMKIVTPAGIEIEIPRAEVSAVVRPGDRTEDGAKGGDPNYSRLLFAPTGRPLKKGDGYFSDYELLFPGLAYGLTSNVSIAGGFSVIPGLGFQEQLFYISPKIGWEIGDRAAVSVGGLLAGVGHDDYEGGGGAVGIGYAVATLGRPQGSVSVGLGIGDASGESRATPILMLGGQATVSRHLALVGETWIVMTRDFRLRDQPFGLGIRFFGDRLSADVGAILVGELLQDGFPVPWVSVTYHFGPRPGAVLGRR